MEPDPNPDIPILPSLSVSPIGYASNGGVRRYLLEAESTTGFVAWKLADGTTLVANTTEISIAASSSLSFWPCASYTDTTPGGQIKYFDSHGNALTHLDVTALAGLAALQILDCSNNRIAALNLDGCTALQDSRSGGNPYLAE
jgi:hypothetical protein